HYVCLLAGNAADPPAATADQPIPLRPHAMDSAGMAPEAVYAGILSPVAPASGLIGQPRSARPACRAILRHDESPPQPPPELAQS
ncbi:MAG TPA: hypothetical protein VD886_04585, partial [Herpetosiphonaceae bacterium]|nr:hypothetical protein [Herpetosiphonaceae bacterium]